MMNIVDIQQMPGFNPDVKNGLDCVTQGNVHCVTKCYLSRDERFGSYPYCKLHGAMLKVSRDGIWRCGELGCSCGCYESTTLSTEITTT